MFSRRAVIIRVFAVDDAMRQQFEFVRLETRVGSHFALRIVTHCHALSPEILVPMTPGLLITPGGRLQIVVDPE